MAELLARTPCQGLLPLEIGTVTATEEDIGTLTVLVPYRGRAGALRDALAAAHGLGLPAPGRVTTAGAAQAIWFGRGQVMLAGPDPDAGLARHAALSDQSDAWAVIRLDGAGAEAVLARLVPIDLRAAAFARDRTVRSQLMHMPASITRVGDRAFRLMVFRSMAATLVHDLKTAMEGVAARG